MSCGDCMYSRIVSKTRSASSPEFCSYEALTCHRYPPSKGWPEVSAESWCGEYQPRREFKTLPPTQPKGH